MQTDCCGSQRATGINVDAATGFADAAPRCADAFGDCACASQPTVGDDGGEAPNVEAEPAVACVDEVCVAVF